MRQFDVAQKLLKRICLDLEFLWEQPVSCQKELITERKMLCGKVNPSFYFLRNPKDNPEIRIEIKKHKARWKKEYESVSLVLFANKHTARGMERALDFETFSEKPKGARKQRIFVPFYAWNGQIYCVCRPRKRVYEVKTLKFEDANWREPIEDFSFWQRESEEVLF